MSRKFLTAIDLAQNELQNARVQNIPGTTGPPTPVKGQLYFDSTGNVLYWYNGSGWVAAQGGAGAVPATTVTTSAVGDASVVGVATTYAREDHKHAREAFGNVVAQTAFGAASANGSGPAVARFDHVHGTPVHDNNAHATIPINALGTPTTNIGMGGFKITGLGTPTVGTDAVTKDYTDNLSAGLSYKDAVRAATTANITLSAPQTVDGVSLIANDRVLVKDQSTGTQNGIYTVAAGAWVRATDADAVGELDGAFVVAMEGTANGDKAWICSTNPPITPGTTATTWAYYGAGTAYTAGAGLALTGSTFDVGAGTGITVAADTVALDTTYTDGRYVLVAAGVKRYAVDVGGATSQVLTHNLNTLDVQVQVYRKAGPNDQIECDVEHTSVNTATVRFATAPSAAEYRAVVMA